MLSLALCRWVHFRIDLYFFFWRPLKIKRKGARWCCKCEDPGPHPPVKAQGQKLRLRDRMKAFIPERTEEV